MRRASVPALKAPAHGSPGQRPGLRNRSVRPARAQESSVLAGRTRYHGHVPGALPRAGMLRALGASTWLSSQSEKTATDRFMRWALTLTTRSGRDEKPAFIFRRSDRSDICFHLRVCAPRKRGVRREEAAHNEGNRHGIHVGQPSQQDFLKRKGPQRNRRALEHRNTQPGQTGEGRMDERCCEAGGPSYSHVQPRQKWLGYGVSSKSRVPRWQAVRDAGAPAIGILFGTRAGNRIQGVFFGSFTSPCEECRVRFSKKPRSTAFAPA